ncbi:MAG: alpha-L-fucosidase [Verrucomicrobia subdivision 3 bacterium]|nr:alpha-L-fucosidase [Limisphaerales bacterium]
MPPRAVVAADNSSVTAGGETAQQRAERVRGFTETRFGMFIRIPVSEDEKFAAQFNPEKFDAREGVQIAKNAGMKYLVITATHQNGFWMFRLDPMDWCNTSTPVLARSLAGTGRGLPRKRHQTMLLGRDPGLAPPGVGAAQTLERPGHGRAGFGSLPRFYEGPTQGASHPLRSGWHPCTITTMMLDGLCRKYHLHTMPKRT